MDVNENLYAPYFTNFAVRGSVKENSRAGTSVLTVSAKDDDKGRDGVLRYSIKGGNGLGTFTIDEDTGVITFTYENACLPWSLSFHINHLYIFFHTVLAFSCFFFIYLNYNCCIASDAHKHRKSLLHHLHCF